jgi:hypothetical protein
VDAYIHSGEPRGILRQLTNAFAKPPGTKQPTVTQLQRVYEDLVRVGRGLKRSHGAIFESRPFSELVVAAQELSKTHGLF